jgi:excisionase family DNA binding protein
MNDERRPAWNAAAIQPPPLDGSDAHGHPLEPLLTASEVAEVIGFQAGTIVDWAERGELPHFKIGGRLRFRQTDVHKWLEERRAA